MIGIVVVGKQADPPPEKHENKPPNARGYPEVEDYEENVDNAVDGLSALLEPMIMAVLGVLIGGLIIAMYLPIFKMGAVV